MELYGVQLWSEIAVKAINDHGLFTAALSGGKTPIQLYEKLAGTELPWDKTHIFQVDERFVPWEHHDSNFGMIRKVFLRTTRISDSQLHPMVNRESTARDAAEVYEKELRSFFSAGQTIPSFDIVFLGLGQDGHTASLFPGDLSTHARSRLAVSVSPDDTTKRERITVTFPVINNACNIVFLIAGKHKAKAVTDVLENEKSSLPAASVKPSNGKLFFLLDQSAAALLSKNSEYVFKD